MKPALEKFCLIYLSNGFNATKAAHAVKKFPDDNSAAVAGCRWLKNKDVVKFLKNHARASKDEHEVTRDWKIEKLKQVIESSIINDIVVDPKSIISAVAELNKMQGHYAPDKVESNHTHQIDLDPEFKALLAAYKREY